MEHYLFQQLADAHSTVEPKILQIEESTTLLEIVQRKQRHSRKKPSLSEIDQRQLDRAKLKQNWLKVCVKPSRLSYWVFPPNTVVIDHVLYTMGSSSNNR